MSDCGSVQLSGIQRIYCDSPILDTDSLQSLHRIEELPHYTMNNTESDNGIPIHIIELGRLHVVIQPYGQESEQCISSSLSSVWRFSI